MSLRSKIAGIGVFFLISGITYWWLYYAPRYDMQLNVIGIQGDVTINGKPITVETQAINANQAVITVPVGGIFNGKLEDGSYIQITENSQLTIELAKRNKDSYRVRTKFILDAGQVIRDIPRVETISDYSSSLITDSVDIGVRGTRYATIADKNSTRTMLYHGAVALDNKEGDTLTLRQNYGTITEPGKPPQKPSKLLPPPTSLTSISGQHVTTPEWDIQWQPVPNAQAYLVEVSEDDDFRNLVYRKEVQTNHSVITRLPYDANFRWRVSSIDNRQLRGKGSKYSKIHYKHHHELVKIYNGSPAEATLLFDKALHGYRNDPLLIKEIGKYFYRINQFKHALSYYNRAIAIEPDNDELLLERGRAYQALNMQPEAEKDFNNSLSIKSNSAEAFWSLGNVEADKGNLEDSIQYYYQAIASEPTHAKAHLSAANAWEKLGQNDKANQHLMFHLENFPNDKKVRQQFERLSLGIESTNQGSSSK